MGSRPSSRARAWAILLTTLILCGILTAINKREAQQGEPGAITSDLRRYVLAPPARVVMTARRWWGSHVAALLQGPELERENERLQALVAMLSQQNRELAGEDTENKRLRALLGFRSSSSMQLLPAEVIAVKPSPLRDSITLSIGDKDGVLRKTVVLDSSGALLGQVTDVTRDTSDVLLLTDDLSSVGVVVRQMNRAQTAGVVGICSGNRSALLSLTDLPQNADVRPGDRVETSGFGGVYPAGIPVGTVRSVSVDGATMLTGALVAPDAGFDNLQDVFVLPPAIPQGGDRSSRQVGRTPTSQSVARPG
jgi:rod shape-determining protein MreC